MSPALGYLAAAVLHGTALAALALGLERLLRPWLSPASATLLWTVVLLKFLVPAGPSLSFSLSSALDSAQQALDLEPLGIQVAAGAGTGEASWARPVLAAYATVGAALLLGRLLAWRRLALAVAGLPVAPPAVEARVRAVAATLGLGRAPPARLGAGAFVLGAWRPTLVLPESLEVGPALEAVLLHELSHLRRGDPWVRLLQVVAGAVFWCWPPVAWVGRRLEQWRELACDQAVLEHGAVGAPAYARLLLQARQGALGAGAGLAALEMASRASRLERRIDALLTLRPARPARGRSLALAAWATLALAGSALAVDGGASPREGTLPREVVATVVRGGTDAIASCYEAALAQEGGLEGKVVLQWTVAPDGAVRDARVAQADYHRRQSSRAVQAQLEGCAVRVVSSLRFPPPSGGPVEVLYPFLFSSQPR